MDDLTPELTPIDYLLGASPKHPEYRTLQTRIDTFDVVNWRLQSISRENSAFLKPEWFARAGFFYTGTADSVSCFCCGLGLGHWEATDDPFVEHAKFYPCCAWLLIRNGRHKVKLSYMKWNIDSIKPADFDLIRDVHDVSGS